MKPVMYHYVRPCAEGLPYFPYLALANFERQLDEFARTYGFVGREAFVDWIEGGSAPDGVLLTFDDGLRDHRDFVLPVLRARGLFGVFYVASGPATTGRILDVHKVHLVLGRLGARAVLAWLESNTPKLASRAMYEDTTVYADQKSDRATKAVKYLFNWQLSNAERASTLDALLAHAFDGAVPRWDDFYLDLRATRELSEAGMGVGPHSHTHEIASRLARMRQKEEIELSCAFVESAGGSRSWGYCYPHGVAESFSDETEKAVADSGCPFAFAVQASDITAPLAETRRFALPRHNCNAFPHGAVCWGEEVSA
jgi:peptidoglycan/xylan/chitin deacetylase (PgdA/CDA1 family)